MLVAFYTPCGNGPAKREWKPVSPLSLSSSNAVYSTFLAPVENMKETFSSGGLRYGNEKNLPCDLACTTAKDLNLRLTTALLRSLIVSEKQKEEAVMVFDEELPGECHHLAAQSLLTTLRPPSTTKKGEEEARDRIPHRRIGKEVFYFSCRWLLESQGIKDLTVSAVRVETRTGCSSTRVIDAVPLSLGFPCPRTGTVTPVQKGNEECMEKGESDTGDGAKTSLFGSRLFPIASLRDVEAIAVKLFSAEDMKREGWEGDDGGESHSMILMMDFSLSPTSFHLKREEHEERIAEEPQRNTLQRTLYLVWIPSIRIPIERRKRLQSVASSSLSSIVSDRTGSGGQRQYLSKVAACFDSLSSSSSSSSEAVLHQCWRESMLCGFLKPFLLGRQPGAWVTSFCSSFFSSSSAPELPYSSSLSHFPAQRWRLSSSLYRFRHGPSCTYTPAASSWDSSFGNREGKRGEGPRFSWCQDFFFQDVASSAAARRKWREECQRDQKEPNIHDIHRTKHHAGAPTLLLCTPFSSGTTRGTSPPRKVSFFGEPIEISTEVSLEEGSSVSVAERKGVSVTSARSSTGGSAVTVKSIRPHLTWPQDTVVSEGRNDSCKRAREKRSSGEVMRLREPSPSSGNSSDHYCRLGGYDPRPPHFCTSAPSALEKHQQEGARSGHSGCNDTSFLVLAKRRETCLQELQGLLQQHREKVQHREEEEERLWGTVHTLFLPVSLSFPSSGRPAWLSEAVRQGSWADQKEEKTPLRNDASRRAERCLPAGVSTSHGPEEVRKEDWGVPALSRLEEPTHHSSFQKPSATSFSTSDSSSISSFVSYIPRSRLFSFSSPFHCRSDKETTKQREGLAEEKNKQKEEKDTPYTRTTAVSLQWELPPWRKTERISEHAKRARAKGCTAADAQGHYRSGRRTFTRTRIRCRTPPTEPTRNTVTRSPSLPLPMKDGSDHTGRKHAPKGRGHCKRATHRLPLSVTPTPESRPPFWLAGHREGWQPPYSLPVPSSMWEGPPMRALPFAWDRHWPVAIRSPSPSVPPTSHTSFASRHTSALIRRSVVPFRSRGSSPLEATLLERGKTRRHHGTRREDGAEKPGEDWAAPPSPAQHLHKPNAVGSRVSFSFPTAITDEEVPPYRHTAFQDEPKREMEQKFAHERSSSSSGRNMALESEEEEIPEKLQAYQNFLNIKPQFKLKHFAFAV